VHFRPAAGVVLVLVAAVVVVLLLPHNLKVTCGL
jgi:hypothetical protein